MATTRLLTRRYTSRFRTNASSPTPDGGGKSGPRRRSSWLAAERVGDGERAGHQDRHEDGRDVWQAPPTGAGRGGRRLRPVGGLVVTRLDMLDARRILGMHGRRI